MLTDESHPHLDAFLAAMQRKDLDAMLTHMADDIVLKTPLDVEPFRGKAAVRPVAQALLRVVDKFDFRETLRGPQHIAVFFVVTVGSIELDAMDYFRLDAAGRVQQMTVLWRPLPSVVAVSQVLSHAGH
jgi:hypothetical protein